MGHTGSHYVHREKVFAKRVLALMEHGVPRDPRRMTGKRTARPRSRVRHRRLAVLSASPDSKLSSGGLRALRRYGGIGPARDLYADVAAPVSTPK